MPKIYLPTSRPTTSHRVGTDLTALERILYHMVAVWAKGLRLLGPVVRLLNLTHKRVVQKDNHPAGVGKFNLKGATVSHNLTDEAGLAYELAMVASHLDFLV